MKALFDMVFAGKGQKLARLEHTNLFVMYEVKFEALWV